jgi:class 3 adenylate cyclase
MTRKTRPNASAQDNIEKIIKTDPVLSEIARISQLDSALSSRLDLPSLSTQISATAGLSEAIKNINSLTPAWANLAKSLDWTKSIGLQTEALKAMDLSSTVRRHTEALRTSNWDIGRLRGELPVNLQDELKESINDNDLEDEIRNLRKEIEKKSALLIDREADCDELQARATELEENLEQLQQKERFAFLLNQVHPAAQVLLGTDLSFREQFLGAKECTGFVVSIDIRRSTELMLKARNPERYAEFISTLSHQLTKEVLESFGVFDKFTGDGILAFFPDFYSGTDSGFYAVSSAMRCHQIFHEHYLKHRSSFISVLQDTGIGVGIDYGKLSLVQVSGHLTVVGPPVVYACRLGGAPAGSTLINQPAYEILSEAYGLNLHFEETSHDIKHEGRVLAYRAELTPKIFEPSTPEWFGKDITISNP